MLKIANGRKNLLTPSSPATAINTFVNEFTGTIAAGTESVSIQIKPADPQATAYIGQKEFTSSNSEADITLKDYLSADGRTVNIPVKLKWAATDSTQPKQERNYSVILTVVDYTPKITTQPVDITCEKDGTATLTVEATAAAGATLTYQWYEVNGEAATAIADATNASYSAPTTEVGEKTYYCIVTSTANSLSYTVQSNSAKVSVFNWEVKPPRILVQPHDITCIPNPVRAVHHGRN